ncbi:hypothetical protein KUCAC02_019849, partial [Chaenocephalus aceratus]
SPPTVTAETLWGSVVSSSPSESCSGVQGLRQQAVFRAKMHFSIPETEVRSGENGSTYVAYNIHVNGVLHCRVRYSQLLGLHEQRSVDTPASPPAVQPPRHPISAGPEVSSSPSSPWSPFPPLPSPFCLFPTLARPPVVPAILPSHVCFVPTAPAAYGRNVVPAFPPKKIFTLTHAEVEQRREQLEKYMQAVRQDPLLGASELFNSFLRKAQQETQQIPTEEVALDICLSNGQKVTVNILTSDQTEDVLDAVATKLDLPDDLVGYFSLFLVREGVDGGLNIPKESPLILHLPNPSPLLAPNPLRAEKWCQLQEFELPYVSITSLRSSEFHILLRKSYWDMSYDADVMDNRVGLNLLYAQTVSDIERGWILVNKDQHRQLKSLQEKGSKKEFIHLGQTLKYYGYIKFDPCITDFPEKGCQVMVSAGKQRAQLPRQAAQRTDEGGKLQGHAHEVLASHVFSSPDSQRHHHSLQLVQM